MAFYLVFLLILLLLSLSNNSNRFNQRLFYGCICVIAIMSAFRDDTVGNDTHNYMVLFDNIRVYPIKAFTFRYEIGYVIFNKAISLFTSNAQWLLIITSLFIWISVCRFFVNYSDRPSLSLFFLITIGLYAFFISGIRESMAIAICLFAFPLIQTKRPILFIITVLIASTFHISSLIFIPAYYLYNNKMSLKMKSIVVLVTISTTILFDRLLILAVKWFPRFNSYLTTDYNNGTIRLASVLNALLVFGLYLICQYFINKDGNSTDEGYNNLLLFGVALLIASFSFNLLDRLANYYTIFLTITIPNILTKSITKTKITCLVIIVYVFIAYFMIVQFLRPEWSSIYPYHTFLYNS